MAQISKWIVALALLASLGNAWAADAVPNGEWTIEVKPAATNTLKGTTQTYPDTIIIKDGKLTTQISANYGYEAGAYEAKTEGGKSIVTAVVKHAKHGSNTYSIEFKDKAVTGTMKWSKTGEDGKTKSAEYVISGTKK